MAENPASDSTTKKVWKFILGACLAYGCIICLSAVKRIVAAHNPNRIPSSTTQTQLGTSHADHKLLELKPNTGLNFKNHGKALGPLQVEIQSENARIIGPGESFQLKALVRSRQEFASLHIQWILPADVQALTGTTEDVVYDIKPGPAREIEITLVSAATENRQIHFRAFQKVDGVDVGEVAQFNTVLQPAIEEHLIQKRNKLSLKSSDSPGVSGKDSVTPRLVQ